MREGLHASASGFPILRTPVVLITQSITIRYRRPDAPWSVGRMVVPGGSEAAAVHIERLKALGYAIVDAVTTPETTDLAPRGGLPIRRTANT